MVQVFSVPTLELLHAMKSHTVHLTLNLAARMSFENITPKVEQIVADSGVREGLCLVKVIGE